MFRGLLQYVPLVPLILAVLLFVLMPFDEARADKGELVQVAAMACIVTPCDIGIPAIHGGQIRECRFCRSKNLPPLHSLLG